MQYFRFIPKTVEDYFMDMITKLVKYRRENKIRRKDFLDILMDMEDKFSEEGYGMEEIISHSMGLFLDGTETSANAMAFVLYQLADNLHVQNRLRDEIEAVKKKHGGKVTYEAVQEMTYLDCVLSGTNMFIRECFKLSGQCFVTTFLKTLFISLAKMRAS